MDEKEARHASRAIERLVSVIGPAIAATAAIARTEGWDAIEARDLVLGAALLPEVATALAMCNVDVLALRENLAALNHGRPGSDRAPQNRTMSAGGKAVVELLSTFIAEREHACPSVMIIRAGMQADQLVKSACESAGVTDQCFALQGG
jgi:hypothetical protein